MDSQKPKKHYYRLCLTLDIYNGKRTEWSPTRFVIIRVIKKKPDDPRRKIRLSITNMITDRIGQHKALLPRNHSRYNFLLPPPPKKKNLGQTSPVATMSKVKNSSILEIPHFCFRISDCCYGYCNQFCDW